MSRKLSPEEVIAQFLAALPAATWEYDDDADEMEILLPGAAGGRGLAVPVDDESYLRVDVETLAPLSLLIQPWTVWLARQDTSAAAQDRQQLSVSARAPRPALAATVEHRMRAAQLDLAA